MLAIPGDAPGLTRTPLRKMGWLCSRHRASALRRRAGPGRKPDRRGGQGLQDHHDELQRRARLDGGDALGIRECCYDEALAWARERKTFGTSLVDHQVIRHKLVDMRMRIESTRAWLTSSADRADAGQADRQWVAEVCMLKNHATQAMQFCADQAVQILGGMGFMRGTASERIYREVKVMMIGGGAEEIMKELASRQLGI